MEWCAWVRSLAYQKGTCETREPNPRLHVVCGPKGLKEVVEGSFGAERCCARSMSSGIKLNREVKFMSGSELEWKAQS